MFTTCPYWAMFEMAAANSSKTGRLLFTYTGDDREVEGWKLLNDNLDVLDNTSPYLRHVIQFYNRLDKDDSLNDRMPHSGSFLFKMQAMPAGGVAAQVSGITPAAPGNMFLEYLQMQIAQKDERIRILEEEVEDLEEEVEEYRHEEKSPKINGIIGQIGEASNQYPVIADILRDAVGTLKFLFMKPGATPAAMAGVSDATAERVKKEDADVVIGKSIEKMASYYVGKEGYFTADISPEQKEIANKKGWINLANDMAKLANLTEDPDTFEFAIKKLRNA